MILYIFNSFGFDEKKLLKVKVDFSVKIIFYIINNLHKLTIITIYVKIFLEVINVYSISFLNSQEHSLDNMNFSRVVTRLPARELLNLYELGIKKLKEMQDKKVPDKQIDIIASKIEIIKVEMDVRGINHENTENPIMLDDKHTENPIMLDDNHNEFPDSQEHSFSNKGFSRVITRLPSRDLSNLYEFGTKKLKDMQDQKAPTAKIEAIKRKIELIEQEIEYRELKSKDTLNPTMTDNNQDIFPETMGDSQAEVDEER